MEVRIKKLHPEAKIFAYAHPGDAGADIFCLEEATIQPRQRQTIRTGIALEFPEGYVGLIWDKSGLARHHGITVFAGVADAGFRGEFAIIAYNSSDEPYTFAKGDKVAQVLFQKVERGNFVEVEELSESARGEGGYGSTGK